MIHFRKNSAVLNLYLYNLFLSCSLTIAANLTYTDRLLLRMNIDLGNFGFIKSVMFLLPAIIYQLTANFLGRLQKDVQVCMISYVIRIILPSFLPFLAMITDDVRTLTIWSVILLPAGMLFAVIANNTLMTIYRKVIPPKQFNYSIGMINMFMAVPTYLLGLPVAWLLDKFEAVSNFNFYLLFGVLQLFTLMFEIPAIYYLRKVRIKYEPYIAPKRGNLLTPYYDRQFRMILLINFLHRMCNGLMTAYLTVYFLEVAHFSMTLLLTINIVLGSLLNFSLPYGGRLMDKRGYENVFVLLAFLLMLGCVVFTACWQVLWILPLFALCCWDCGASPTGGWLGQGGYASSIKLAGKESVNAAVAAYSICNNGGLFAGLLGASWLYALSGVLVNGSLSEHLRCYFVLTLPFFAALLAVCIIFKYRYRRIN